MSLVEDYTEAVEKIFKDTWCSAYAYLGHNFAKLR